MRYFYRNSNDGFKALSIQGALVFIVVVFDLCVRRDLLCFFTLNIPQGAKETVKIKFSKNIVSIFQNLTSRSKIPVFFI